MRHRRYARMFCAVLLGALCLFDESVFAASCHCVDRTVLYIISRPTLTYLGFYVRPLQGLGVQALRRRCSIVSMILLYTGSGRTGSQFFYLFQLSFLGSDKVIYRIVTLCNVFVLNK